MLAESWIDGALTCTVLTPLRTCQRQRIGSSGCCLRGHGDYCEFIENHICFQKLHIVTCSGIVSCLCVVLLSAQRSSLMSYGIPVHALWVRYILSVSFVNHSILFSSFEDYSFAPLCLPHVVRTRKAVGGVGAPKALIWRFSS
jgi:hypothetical protein